MESISHTDVGYFKVCYLSHRSKMPPATSRNSFQPNLGTTRLLLQTPSKIGKILARSRYTESHRGGAEKTSRKYCSSSSVLATNPMMNRGHTRAGRRWLGVLVLKSVMA